jgi:plastocyanin
MRFRTHLAAAAAVAMLVGLAACGDDDETASSGTSTTTDTAVSGSASEASPSASHGAGHSDSSSMITMTDNKFAPANLTVAPGTEVMVMNEGQATHDLKDDKTKGKEFDSGDITAGGEGKITAPDAAGAYPYYCTYHFGMTGTLTVK